MTIRRYLLWRITTAWAAVPIGYLLIALALVNVRPKPAGALVLAAACLPWALFVLLQARVKCPRCGYTYFLLNLWNLMNLTHCPNCRVSLDEPCEAPGSIH